MYNLFLHNFKQVQEHGSKITDKLHSILQTVACAAKVTGLKEP